MKRTIYLISIIVFILFTVHPCRASSGEKLFAEFIGKHIISLFKPERVKVRIRKKSPEAWIEIYGGIIDGIKIQKMKLSASLDSQTPTIITNIDSAKLAEVIKNSTGEVELAEKDINNYFRENKNPEGFSDLQFDFKKYGFLASGEFRTRIIIDMELPILAKGVLVLRNEAVYLENTIIKVDDVRQPEFLTEMILSRINPLLEFKNIPFPVTFKKIIMTDDTAIMTGEPKEFKTGETWYWNNTP